MPASIEEEKGPGMEGKEKVGNMLKGSGNKMNVSGDRGVGEVYTEE